MQVKLNFSGTKLEMPGMRRKDEDRDGQSISIFLEKNLINLSAEHHISMQLGHDLPKQGEVSRQAKVQEIIAEEEKYFVLQVQLLPL